MLASVRNTGGSPLPSAERLLGFAGDRAIKLPEFGAKI